MRSAFLSAVVLLAAMASAQVAPTTQPLSPEEATRRLEERQAQREASRNQKVTITRGELEDLRAQIASLKAEIATLKGDANAQQPAAADPPKFTLEITTGTTRAQLVTFISLRKDRYRIAKDVRSPDKQEIITLEKFETKSVFDGYTSNGVSQLKTYKKEKNVLRSWDIVLVNDVITEIGGSDGSID
jgi:hypothetical protein